MFEEYIARQNTAYAGPIGTWAERWLPLVCKHETVRCTHGDEIIGRRMRRRVCMVLRPGAARRPAPLPLVHRPRPPIHRGGTTAMPALTRTDLLARDCYPVGELPRAVELPCGCRYSTTAARPELPAIDLARCGLHTAERDAAEVRLRNHTSVVGLRYAGISGLGAGAVALSEPAGEFCRLCSGGTAETGVTWPCDPARLATASIEDARTRLVIVRALLIGLPTTPLPEEAEYQRLLHLGIVQGCHGRPFGEWCTRQPQHRSTLCRRCSPPADRQPADLPEASSTA